MRPCVLALLIILVPLNVWPAVRVGLRGGAGVSWLSFPSEYKVLQFDPPIVGSVQLKEGVRPAASAGVFLLLPIGAGFSAEQAVSVTMRGGNLKGGEALTVDGYPDITVGVEYREDYKLTSVDAAFLLRYTSPDHPNAKYFAVGPEFHHVFYSKWEGSQTASVGGFFPEGQAEHADVLDLTHSLNMGLLIVLGVEFQRKSYSIFADLRFGMGLTNIYEFGTDEPKTRHRGLVLGLGIMK